MITRRAIAVMVGIVYSGGCAEPSVVEVEFRITTARNDDPYLGGTELLIVATQGPRLLSETHVPIDAREVEVGAFDFGEAFSLRIDVFDRTTLLARGRSFPFDVSRDQPAPQPDVWIGRLGRFVSQVDAVPDGEVLAITPATQGALFVTASGTLYAYDAHTVESGQAQLTMLGSHPDRSDSVWTAWGDGMLLSIGGSTGGAVLFDESGEAVAALGRDELGEQHQDMAVAVLSERQVAVVIGGTAFNGTELDAVRRIELTATGELMATVLDPLSAPIVGSAATTVQVASDGGPADRVVLVGGTRRGEAQGEVVLIDPLGDAAMITFDLPTDRTGAALAVLSTGLVLLAGGETAAGLTDEVLVLSVRSTTIEAVSPAPPPLFVARRNPAVVSLGPGLVLLVGGQGAMDAPLSSSEIIEVSTDVFPGDVVASGNLPVPLSSGHAVALGDRSILVVGPEALLSFVPPRGQ